MEKRKKKKPKAGTEKKLKSCGRKKRGRVQINPKSCGKRQTIWRREKKETKSRNREDIKPRKKKKKKKERNFNVNVSVT